MSVTPAGAGPGMARPCGVRHPYVALEGADGAGKTTVARRLRLALEARGLPCFSPGQHSWLDPEATRIISRARGRHGEIRAVDVDRAYRRDFALLQRHC